MTPSELISENQNQNQNRDRVIPSGNDSADMFIAFSSPLVQEMIDSRLAPTYIGVRRQRPSNRLVQSAWRNGTNSERQNTNVTENISFFVKDENGNERRMTKKEKKLLKNQLRLEKKELKRKRKLSRCSQSVEKGGEDSSMGEEHPNTKEKAPTVEFDGPLLHSGINHYHHFTVNSTTLEEEISDLRGDRDSVPPVSLMPAMWMETEKLLRFPTSLNRRQDFNWNFDEDLSKKWATELRMSLSDSEEVRHQEDMRPMAYKLVPEVWNRLRPVELADNSAGIKNECTGTKDINSTHKNDSKHWNEQEWTKIPIRNETSHLDFDKNIIFSLLMSRTELYIACGAKFGSGFLLYDGPRHERHAFAGLRVWDSLVQNLPTPYDMHGFVRCLNTAGKLSLLAKVERNVGDENSIKVAIVDLALEKVLSAPRHSQRSIMKARRDVGKSLTKRKNDS